MRGFSTALRLQFITSNVRAIDCTLRATSRTGQVVSDDFQQQEQQPRAQKPLKACFILIDLRGFELLLLDAGDVVVVNVRHVHLLGAGRDVGPVGLGGDLAKDFAVEL